jgi:hypothetical protein
MSNINTDTNNLDKNVDSLKTYQSTLQQLNAQLNPILVQFQKSYVNYEMSPTNNEYERIFLTSTSNMKSLNSQLFSIQSDIIKKNQTLDQSLLQINKKIQEAKKENQLLNQKYNKINSKQHGSIELIYEFNDTYNLDYSTNFHLLIGVLLSLYVTIQIFSDRTISNYNHRI